MCQQQQQTQSPHENNDTKDGNEASSTQPTVPFPWHIGAFDAHCHPTDTMSSIASIPSMKAHALTIMATRSQDQHLVDEVARDLGIQGPESLPGAASGADTTTTRDGPRSKVIPAFGWHPWFSYQIYDDRKEGPSTFHPEAHAGSVEAAKKAHYEAVLQPTPSEDTEFIASLPTPAPLSQFIEETRSNLEAHPYALVGEVGLDKALRIPQQWPSSSASSSSPSSRDENLTPGGREGRPLSPYRVQMQHQQAILEAQLRLAGEKGRAVSIHGVQAHGVLFESVSKCWKGHEREYVSKRKRKMDAAPAPESDSEDESKDQHDSQRKQNQGQAHQAVAESKPFPPRICLHSFSGSVELLNQWLHPTNPAEIFFSFSTAVNAGSHATKSRTAEVIRGIPDSQLLVESDLHIAGEGMDTALEDMYRRICDIKGWTLKEGVTKIRENFQRFIFG